MTTYSSSPTATVSAMSEEPVFQHGMVATEREERSAAMFSRQTTLGGVLVIDDESDVRKVVRMTLEKAGYFVVEAENEGQAIQVMNEGEHPMMLAFIITDIQMPKINGLEASCTDQPAMIKIEDTGPGIPEEHMKKTFEPF